MANELKGGPSLFNFGGLYLDSIDDSPQRVTLVASVDLLPNNSFPVTLIELETEIGCPRNEEDIDSNHQLFIQEEVGLDSFWSKYTCNPEIKKSGVSINNTLIKKSVNNFSTLERSQKVGN